MDDRERRGDENELVDALVQTSFAAMAVLNRLAAEHDLSLTQLRVMAILRDRRLRMSQLVDYLGLEKSTMTGLVARAEKRGLLRRLPNPDDGRAVDVVLTESGARLAARITPRVTESLAPLIRQLGRRDQEQLHQLLIRMLAPTVEGLRAAVRTGGGARPRRSSSRARPP